MLKRIDKLLISVYLKYFVSVLVVTMFILVIGMFYSYMKLIIDKNLGIATYAQILRNFVMVFIPSGCSVAVLISSILTFTNLSETLELCAMKSLGISFWRILLSFSIGTIIIGICVFICSHHLTPKSIRDTEDILFDLKKMNPSLTIKEKEFFNDFPGYTVYVDKKDGNKMSGVMIYAHKRKDGKKTNALIVGDHGYINVDNDGQSMLFSLDKGVNYLASSFVTDDNKDEEVHVTMNFKKQDIYINSQMFKSGSANHYNDSVVSFKLINDIIKNDSQIAYYDGIIKDEILKLFNDDDQKNMSLSVLNLKDFINDIKRNKKFESVVEDVEAISDKYSTEIRNMKYRKLANMWNYYELSRRCGFVIACFVMMITGISIGFLMNRGGIIFPLSIASVLISVYFVFNFIGENMFMNGFINPFWGGFSGCLSLLPFTTLFLVAAVRDIKIFAKIPFLSSR